jgi:hypothetical protein
MKRLLVLCIFFYLALQGCSLSPTCGGAQAADPCLRILFIGNSYTYVNDLPATFKQLAAAGGHRVETGMLAEGGWTLAQHLAAPATRDKLASAHWDDVVLQEQSEIPAVERSRSTQMYPAARELAGKIRAAGASPIFFMTWAHRDGLPANGLLSYESMQGQIDAGYAAIASELAVPIAPVGAAWWAATWQASGLELWQADGSHPSTQGTYLAACVFYAVIFRQSPVGLSYHSDLSAETARTLQSIAADTVLKDQQEWHLP